VAASDVGRPFYLRDNGGVGAEGGGLNDYRGEATANNALNHYRLVEANFAARVVDSQLPTDARTGRRPVHLSLSKDTDVAAMRPLGHRRADEDGAVEKAQVLFEGVGNRPAGHYRPLDGHTLLDQHAKVLRCTGHTDLLRLHVNVKRTPKGDVVAHFTQARDFNRFTKASTKE